MKTLYLNCGMGAAGDMLTAALLELMPDPAAAAEALNAIGIPGVTYRPETVYRCGVRGTHMSVMIHGAAESETMHDHHHEHEHAHHHDHDHHHAGLHGITHMVEEHLRLPEAVKADVLAVYGLIAQAESHVHGVPVPEIHFHEVGTLDALADVAAVCLLLHRLAPERIIASPVCVGSGQVRCAHGILPVPAPATAWLLQGIPSYEGAIPTELCTPTGAALLRHFVTSFGPMPVMTTQAIGYGMGTKEFEAANCLRAFWGDTAEEDGQVAELACNLDDMTAEELAFAMEALLDAGALDVWAVPLTMKKSRPGTLLTVLCPAAEGERMAALLFRHTTTIGVRQRLCRRYTLTRREHTVSTPYGDVRCKTSRGYGVERVKYEYEDLSRIARAQDMPLRDVRTLAEQAED